MLPEAPPGTWREPDEDELRGDTIPAPPPTEPQAGRIARASELGNRIGFHRFNVSELRQLAGQLGDMVDAAERQGGAATRGPFYSWLRMSEARCYMQLALRDVEAA
jgi:hypothetical protein